MGLNTRKTLVLIEFHFSTYAVLYYLDVFDSLTNGLSTQLAKVQMHGGRGRNAPVVIVIVAVVGAVLFLKELKGLLHVTGTSGLGFDVGLLLRHLRFLAKLSGQKW